jgi:Zn-finger nucleic acid-binding protein
MIAKRVISVEIDMCPGCSGIVLDKGEPEAIEALGVARIIEGTMNRASAVAPTIQASGSLHPGIPPRTSTAHCHECQQDMMALVGAGDIEYDWCDKCERIFFDRGELSALEAFKPE